MQPPVFRLAGNVDVLRRQPAQVMRQIPSLGKKASDYPAFVCAGVTYHKLC